MESKYRLQMEKIWIKSKKKIPFDGLPENTVDVQIFPNMPNPLMNCHKIVKKGHKIILDNPIAIVINKLTNEVAMEEEFDHQTSTWNVYPDKPVPYESNEKQKVKSLQLGKKKDMSSILQTMHIDLQKLLNSIIQ